MDPRAVKHMGGAPRAIGRSVRVHRGREPNVALAAWPRSHHLRDTGRVMAEESTTPELDSFRRSVQAFNGRDLEMTASIYAPDVVWDGTEMGIGRFDGRAEFRAFLEDWLAAYDEVKLDAEEVLDLGNGVAFAILHQKARLIGSEGYVEQGDGWTFLWEHGLVVQATVYPERDIDKARAAAERLAESRE